jgi:NadR type nicotinamide-nucleotide adenylyltransferase
MVLGKFLPPHLGHVYLIEFAQRFVDDLTVVVGTLQHEPIPGELRFRWMRELFPSANVVHLTDENPQDPSEHPDFWRIWHESLRRVLPYSPDFVFASEDYGVKLAEVLGARFIPVNQARDIVPVSGTAIREQPLRNWEYLPRCVRPHFAKRVCIFGPESTGKSTLTRDLARHFQTVAVPEYARTWLEARHGEVVAADMPIIARGQMASEEALARNANRVLFCDTDVLTTTLWSEWLFGSCDEAIRQIAAQQHYDLYLITDVDVPWVADVVRYLPEERRSFFDRCLTTLQSHQRPHVVIRGSWNERFETAVAAVNQLLGLA